MRNVEKEVKALKENYKKNLDELQKKCKHKWIEDGTDVEGWYEVKVYKCSICEKTKTER